MFRLDLPAHNLNEICIAMAIWSNILVVDSKVSGSDYFPDYWEPNSWPQLLVSRLESSESAKWIGMWGLEQQHKAPGQYAQWAGGE
jgi:hypothetical protein